MSQHTPHHHTHPTDPDQTDLVAGDPPVPLTVWRTARTTADATRSVGARLAARLVAAYSSPGEAVVDLTDGHTLRHACATGARRHHRAWFTDAASLIIGPATPPAPTDTTDEDDVADQDDAADLNTWFGNDLTDPDLPPPAEPVATLRADQSLAGATSLVVACWPLDATDDANRVRLAWLLTACARLLRPGGCLILVVAVPPGSTATPQDFSNVVAAAAGIGLGYLQHIVAVTADTSDDGDAFVYHVTDEELLALAATSDTPWRVMHVRVHADLLVFHQNRSPERRTPPRPGHLSGQRGGGHRG